MSVSLPSAIAALLITRRATSPGRNHRCEFSVDETKAEFVANYRPVVETVRHRAFAFDTASRLTRFSMEKRSTGITSRLTMPNLCASRRSFTAEVVNRDALQASRRRSIV